MLATGKSLRTFLVLAICFIGSIPTYSQSSTFLNISKSPSNRTSSGGWLAKCQAISTNAFAGGRYSEETEWPAIANGIAVDRNAAVALDKVCLEAARSAPPWASADNPCRQDVIGVSGASGVPRAVPRAVLCNETTDTIPAELSAFGKAGVKIARAREEVLEILRSENACTDWFASKDASPANTFQSLNFLLDQRGPLDVIESNQPESIVIFRQPYVARATQDGGAHTAITINAHGAFYRPQGKVLKTVPEGGPVHTDGTRMLTVGSYRGDTLPAQMVTLLHEFGHIIDLLPEDADNLDGKSVRNTNEVLRHCRAEVEARSQLAKPTIAKR
jgi:hypothetical protein